MLVETNSAILGKSTDQMYFISKLKIFNACVHQRMHSLQQTTRNKRNIMLSTFLGGAFYTLVARRAKQLVWTWKKLPYWIASYYCESLMTVFILFNPLVAQCYTMDITIQTLWFLITQQIQGGNGLSKIWKFIVHTWNAKNHSKTHIASCPPKKAQGCLFTKWISCLTENPRRNNASAAASAASAADGSCGQLHGGFGKGAKNDSN